MAYAIAPTAPLDAEIRRVAGEQTRKIEAGLKAALEATQDVESVRAEAIHDARKRLKKLRGLIRLVRGASPKFYARENTRYREAARRLAAFRDAAALIEASDRLTKHYEGRVEPALFAGLRDELVARRDATATEAGGDADREESLREAIEAVLAEVGESRHRFDGFVIGPKEDAAGILASGFGRIYRRARKGLKAAEASGDAEAFHALRKQLKYGWMHLRLLRAAWPALAVPLAEEAKAAVDALGEDHDLAVLLADIEAEPAAFGPAEDVSLLTTIMRQRQDELRAEALATTRRLLAAGPKDVETALRPLLRSA